MGEGMRLRNRGEQSARAEVEASAFIIFIGLLGLGYRVSLGEAGKAVAVMVSMPDAYWLGLMRVRGVGPRIGRLLLERFHSAQRVFEADEAELLAAGIPRPTARNI